MLRILALAAAGAVLLPLSTLAEQIDFDDLPAANDSLQLISDEYAHLGAHFRAIDDGATWDGTSAGDPGGFGLDGSRGANFLGFDGPGYAIAINFDGPVRNFQLDMARAAGAPPFFLDQFQLSGFFEGRLVETKAGFFGALGEWKTLALGSEVDRVVWFGTGLRGHRYAVDALSWEGAEPVPEVMGAWVDVRPGNDRNAIQVRARGVVPVVVYGDETLAVEDIDVGTLAFGPGGTGVAHAHGPHFRDVDGDGRLDMLVHHRVRAAKIPGDAELVCLTGATWDGRLFEGCDLVTPVPR